MSGRRALIKGFSAVFRIIAGELLKYRNGSRMLQSRHSQKRLE